MISLISGPSGGAAGTIASLPLGVLNVLKNIFSLGGGAARAAAARAVPQRDSRGQLGGTEGEDYQYEHDNPQYQDGVGDPANPDLNLDLSTMFPPWVIQMILDGSLKPEDVDEAITSHAQNSGTQTPSGTTAPANPADTSSDVYGGKASSAGSFLKSAAPWLLTGASVVGNIVGARSASNAAEKAAEIQAAGAKEATDLSRDIYNRNRDDMMPWQNVGRNSLYRLSDLMGLPPEKRQTPAGPILAPGQTAPPQTQTPMPNFDAIAAQYAQGRRRAV